VRNFADIAKGENTKLSEDEIDLRATLIENMSDEFKPERYRDEYRERVQAMLDEKSKGQEITVAAPEAPRHGQLIDLMQALKQSIEKAKPKRKAAQVQSKRKAASSDSYHPFICSACAVFLLSLTESSKQLTI
jgi:non-homologous end joining protein Ku